MIGTVINDGEHYVVGTGYVALPSDIDRDKYLKDCYMNYRISIKCEDGSFINRVPVNVEVMDFLDFPDKPEELGTEVVYVTEQVHQQPIIIGRLTKADDLGDGRERMFQIRRLMKDRVVSICGDAMSGVLSLNVIGGQKKGEMHIYVENQEATGLFKLEVAGDIEIDTTNKTTLRNHKKFESIVSESAEKEEKQSIIQQDQERVLVKSKRVLLNADEFSAITFKGYNIFINKNGIVIDSLNKPVKIKSNSSSVKLTEKGVDIEGGMISINGAFEALYNTTPGVPITDVSQIGVSKKVKIG